MAHGSFRRGVRVATVSALLAAAVVRAPAAGEPADGMPVIERLQSIWLIPEAEKTRRHRLAVEVTVNYYDHAWTQLWCEDEAGAFFLGTGGNPDLGIREGQRVRLTGTFIPAEGLRFTDLRAEVIEASVPPRVTDATGILGDRDRLNERLVRFEGFIEAESENDPAHLRFVLICEGRMVRGIVKIAPGAPRPRLAGQLARVTGIYLGRLDPAGQLTEIETYVPSLDRIERLGAIEEDPRFQRAATPIVELPAADPQHPVRIAGRVHAIEPGRSLTIRDATGQAELRTAQQHEVAINDVIEAIGWPRTEGLASRLDAPLWRLVPELVNAASRRRTLTLADDVARLPVTDAGRALPVHLKGVVTWAAVGTPFLFLQDATGGVRVVWDPAGGFDRFICGSGIEIEGVTAADHLGPCVRIHRAVDGPLMSRPEPLRLALEQAQTGAGELRWVEMDGFLRAATAQSGRWARLSLTTPTGEITATIPAGEPVERSLGSFVRIRGVCTTRAETSSAVSGVELWVPGASDVVTLAKPPADPFGVPPQPAGELARLVAQSHFVRWFHTEGTVVLATAGSILTIQDGDAGFTVHLREQTAVRPGDRLAVVGIPGRDGPRALLRETVVRRLPPAPAPEPLPLEPPFPLDPSLESRLVRIRGQLTAAHDLAAERVLTVAAGSTSIVGRFLPAPGAAKPSVWQPGSEVEVTGVYRLRYDENRLRTGFELLLRGPDDVAVLQQPAWWTPGRTLAATGILGGVTAWVTLWVLILRRRVRRQTEEIRLQLERQAALEAELERAQRLRSLGTLAGGIAHDFNNLLTVISGNLSLAQLDNDAVRAVGDCLKEAELGTRRAHDLTQQLITFAKGGNPMLESLALGTVLDDASRLALDGSRAHAEFSAPAGLWPVLADKAQVTRALQNLLLHGRTAMAAGGTISVVASNETIAATDLSPLAPGRYVRIAVTDSGRPIPAEQRATIFDPYSGAKFGDDRFGLATAYAIVKRHDGHIDVQPGPAGGSTFRVWLPAAESAPVAATEAPEDFHPVSLKGRRILVMDDEESIRRLTDRFLRMLGCEPVLTADGAEAIAAFQSARAAGEPFDLVITDLTVPGGMGGAEAIQRIRTIDPQARAIVSSGYSHDAVIAEFRAHGFHAFVRKPYNVATLAEAVRRVLGEPRPPA